MHSFVKLPGLLVAAVLATVSLASAAELVMFDDPTCIYCKRWSAEVGPGYPHTEEGQRAPLRRVPIGEQARAGIQLKTPITATPTFVLADEDAREVGRIVGYPGADYFYPLLDEILSKLPKQAPKRAPQRETQLRTQ